MPIVLSERTWRRIERLLNEGERQGTDVGPFRSGRGVRWVIVRCDSSTAVGVGTDTQLDQLYPATIIFLSADVDYPPLGEADDTVIGDPCLLTVLGTDGADCPVAVEPIEGRVYAGQLTADVEIDPDVTGLVRARRRVVGIDIYPPLDPAPVTGTGTDNHVARWNGTGTSAIQDSGAVLDDAGGLTLPVDAYFQILGSGVDIVSIFLGLPPASGTTFSTGARVNVSATDGAFIEVRNPGLDEYLRFTLFGETPRYAISDNSVGGNPTVVFEGVTVTEAGMEFTGGLRTGGAFTGGSGTVTSVSGGSTGLTVNDPTTTPTLAGILNLASGGTGSLLTDPAADAFMGWDDSAGATIFFAPDASLVFSGTGVGVGEIDLGTW